MIPHLTRKCPFITPAERTKIVLRVHGLTVEGVDPLVHPSYNPETGRRDAQFIEVEDNDTTPNDGNLNSATPANTHESNIGSATQSAGQTFDGLNVLAEASRQVGRSAQPSNGDLTNANYHDAAQYDSDHLHNHHLPIDPQLNAVDLTQSPPQNGMLINLLPISLTYTKTNLLLVAPAMSTDASFVSVYSNNMSGSLQTGGYDLSMTSTAALDLPTIAATAEATMVNASMSDHYVQMSNNASHQLFTSTQDQGLTLQRPGSFQWPATSSVQLHGQPSHLHQSIRPLDQHLLDSSAEGSVPMKNRRPSKQHLKPIAKNPGPLNLAPADSELPASSSKPKVRGKFTDEEREKVSAVREMGACIRCRMLKKTCDQDTPCGKCAGIQNPRLFKFICQRTKLEQEFPHYFTKPHVVLADQEIGSLRDYAVAQDFTAKVEASHFQGLTVTFKARKLHRITSSTIPENVDESVATDEEVILVDLDTNNVQDKVKQYLKSITSQIINNEVCTAMHATLYAAKAIEDQQQGTGNSDNLVSDIIELWVATAVIMDQNLMATFTLDIGGQDDKIQIDETTYPLSRQLLMIQLRAAVEKRASVVCKDVLSHFEARMMGPKKDLAFDDFLVGFILLNCAERMSWSYQAWSTTNANRQYPLDHSPAHYAEKADTFAQMIEMRLTLRQLEPKLKVDNRTRALLAKNPANTRLVEWLEITGLTQDLRIHFGPLYFDANDCRSLDGVFSTRLLQF